MFSLVCAYNVCLVITGVCLIFEVFYIYYYPSLDGPIKVKEESEETDLWITQHAQISLEEREKIKENTCNIPMLDPYEPTILESFKPYNLDCSIYKSYYFKAHVSSEYPGIIMIKPIPENFTCCFEVLRFTDSAKDKYRPLNFKSDRCFLIYQNGSAVPSESQYIIVNCWNFKVRNTFMEPLQTSTMSTPTHRELHFFAPKPSQTLLNKLKKRRNAKSEPINVIIMGFDGISRLNFIRLMGRTFSYLKSNLNAIDLQGYNKIGDATLNNTAAFLTGYDSTDLRKVCWKNMTTFDDCPWIWKNFSEKGYITAYADDYNSVFDYRFKGFQVQPTDIYMHPFISWIHKRDRWSKFGEYNCIGTERAVDLLQDHLRKTSSSLRDHPYLHFAWQSRVHERPGYPSLIDRSTVKTLKHFEHIGILNKSVVILLSDHGWRTGPLMLHPQARVENKMPLAFIALPNWFKSLYPLAYANLVGNQYRLTTPYDIYETMMDILNARTKLPNSSIIVRSTRREETRGKRISLFLPVPKERTCETANINELWCVCGRYKRFSANSSVAIALGIFAVKTINSWLVPFKECHQYSLKEVMSAEVKLPGKEDDNITTYGVDLARNQTFRLTFTAFPKESQFEVVIFSEGLGRKKKSSIIAKMSTEVFRINRYGRSDCMKIYALKKLCTCKKEKKSANNNKE